jgi:predicted transcriptional regulator of viral defense system
MLLYSLYYKIIVLHFVKTTIRLLGDATIYVTNLENCICMHARDYILSLASRGRYHFTSQEAYMAISGNPASVRAQLRRLKKRTLIAEPVRSFHVIVPPEYMRLGCLPAEQFIDQLMEVYGEVYYVALLSAAERHGAAHQRPQVTQVMVSKNRESIMCGQVRVDFIARASLANMPVVQINNPRGVARYSSPEVTALELFGYPNHAGGLSNAATVLSELKEELNKDKLLEVAQLSPVSWSQRLGYILELVGNLDCAARLRDFVQKNARSYTPLRRAAKTAGGKRNADWKLIVNVEVEPDL